MKSTTAERQRRLIELMAAHSLTRGDVARILGLQPRPGGSHGTVDMWLSGARNIPASKLELIEIKAPGWRDLGSN
jgi:transcriptional regulator with XRE-family HTH domain